MQSSGLRDSGERCRDRLEQVGWKMVERRQGGHNFHGPKMRGTEKRRRSV